MRAALATCLLLVALPARAGVPPEVPHLIEQYCLRCHGTGKAPYDLRKLPEATDTGAWLHILEMVESNQMPPPATAGPLEKRFPIPPEARDQLIDGIAQLLGPLLDAHAHARFLSNESWFGILREVAGPIVPPDKLQKILAPAQFNLGVWFVFDRRPRDLFLPYQQVHVDNTSEAVCDAMADAELQRPVAERTLLKALPAPKAALDAKNAKQLIGDLYQAVFTEMPTDTDIAEGRALLKQIRRSAPDWREPWVGLCTAYFSGPKLFYGTFVKPPAKER